MKFVDLLEDYCKVGEIRIMKVPNSNTFVAIISLHHVEEQMKQLAISAQAVGKD